MLLCCSSQLNCQNFNLRIAYNTVICKNNVLKVKGNFIVVFLKAWFNQQIVTMLLSEVLGRKLEHTLMMIQLKPFLRYNHNLDQEIDNHKRKMSQHKAF